jgi:hypothetical protein
MISPRRRSMWDLTNAVPQRWSNALGYSTKLRYK